VDASTDAYSESISAATSSEGSQIDDEEGSYFWQMLTFGYTVEWYVSASVLQPLQACHVLSIQIPGAVPTSSGCMQE